MKLVSWNVNGLRAVMNKGFAEVFQDLDADAVCLQETKLQKDQIDWCPKGYSCFWNYAEKKGYSGTAVFTRRPPLDVRYGMGVEEHDHEGRLITLEFGRFFLVNAYVPNSQDGLKRLDYRMRWEDDLLAYLKELEKEKPVVLCGDLNVAHREIDLKNPRTNRMNAGFTDTFRYLHPDETGAYSWWSYRFRARENNAGWRIDYFIVSDALRSEIAGASILSDVTGSDHCPVELILREERKEEGT